MRILKTHSSTLLAPLHPHGIVTRKCPFNTFERQVDDLRATVKIIFMLLEVRVDIMANLA